jgi:hypothetical protein
LAGLRGDLSSRVDQLHQVIDRAAQPAPTPTRHRVTAADRRQIRGPGRRSAQRLAGVDQQPLGIANCLLGEPGELTSEPPHRGLCLVTPRSTAQPQLRCDRMRPLAC